MNRENRENHEIHENLENHENRENREKRDLRGSFAAKCAAVFLFFLTLTAALVGCGIVIAQSYGFGTSDSFEDDPMYKDTMKDALHTAMDYVLDPESYYVNQLTIYYSGFSAKIYDGEPLEENLAGSWSDTLPEDVWYQSSHAFDHPSAKAGYFTVVGCLSYTLHLGSIFMRDFQLYQFLHSFDYIGTAAMTVTLAVAALALLIFLFFAAGHRAGRPGVYPNWLDRIPLDLYLLGAAVLFTITLYMVDWASGWNMYAPLMVYTAPLALSLLCMAAVILATLLTLATRLKMGKWWRNTVCLFLLRWCWRIWKSCWRLWERCRDACLDFIHILPLTWRSLIFTGGVLLLQTFFSIGVLEAYDAEPFFFLLLLVMDAALLVGAAWLTRQLQLVKDMGKALAAGELEAKLDTRKLFRDIKAHAECLNAISEGMNEAVEKRMRSERLKTELITNVSHDIKTPLTSIVNYVDFLKKEDLPPAAAEYVAVLDRQANRLKKLTEDLVEASKASTGNIAVSLEPIVVNEIVHQAAGDYDERLAAGKLEVIVSTYEGNLIALTDGRLLWRVLDNLLSNVCKYAMAGTRVYIDLGTRDGSIFLTIKNISRDPLNVNPSELVERFVRGDASRHIEGSGLGLNIARSLMDLMGGGLALSVDGDLFKAELTLPMAVQNPWEKERKEAKEIKETRETRETKEIGDSAEIKLILSGGAAGQTGGAKIHHMP